jgi:hypothetical protein
MPQCTPTQHNNKGKKGDILYEKLYSYLIAWFKAQNYSVFLRTKEKFKYSELSKITLKKSVFKW